MQEKNRKLSGIYKQRTPRTNPRGSESGGYLLSHNAVQYHRRCCLSLLPSPLCRASPLRCSPLSLPRPRPLPRAAGAHTAARPAPLMHCERGVRHHSLMGHKRYGLSQKSLSLFFERPLGARGYSRACCVLGSLEVMS